MTAVIKAMTIMLKSLPNGIKFNICSFGSIHSFLWDRSQAYDQSSLDKALAHINTFDANLGGTEILSPMRAVVGNRYLDLSTLDVILLTDGQVWNQQALFDFVDQSTKDHSARVFSLGIGNGASTALVEGIATAGDGFCQFVNDDAEKMGKKMVRLLKGALTPHIRDYKLTVKWSKEDDDYDLIPSPQQSTTTGATLPIRQKEAPKQTISLYDTTTKDEDDQTPLAVRSKDKYDHLPSITPPSLLQTPSQLPSLYPFSRTTVYLLLGPGTHQQTPETITIRGTSDDGPLELEIPVQAVGVGETIHQLAAKKAIHELEKGRGWLADTQDETGGTSLKSKFEGRWGEIVEREAVRLGMQYQVGGKWCSFVAREENGAEMDPVVLGQNIQPTLGGNTVNTGWVSGQGSGSTSVQTVTSYNKHAMPPMHWAASVQPVTYYATSSTLPQPCSYSDARSTMRSRRPTVCMEQVEAQEKIHKIICLQKFDGSWDWTANLIDIIGVSSDARSSSGLGAENAVTAAALAIAFIRFRATDDEDSWELIIEKAMNWLGQQEGVNVDKLIGDAEVLVKSLN